MQTKKIAIILIVAIIFSLVPAQIFAATYTIQNTRIYGNDRIETALEICDEGWTTADTVIIAPADQENLVDALAAAPLAGQEDAPILLTQKDRLDSRVKARISSLGASKVDIVGAISDLRMSIKY